MFSINVTIIIFVFFDHEIMNDVYIFISFMYNFIYDRVYMGDMQMYSEMLTRFKTKNAY